MHTSNIAGKKGSLTSLDFVLALFRFGFGLPVRRITPPPKELVTPDTLTKPKQTSLVDYRSGNLSLGRTAVLNDLGAIPQVSLDCFESVALPPLRGQIDIASIKTLLEHAEVWSRDSGWTALKKEPKVSGVFEEATFEPLRR
ncbi:hypothetical protein BKA82DRAFT_25803 [Pisolithus tinctorius]|uniref:Uncharacterized protein n=1 Tax=Pisolithus tinctorius Marx 270 TaxID=870435 RepID=A0A0C3NWH1_PISTI|nr:hypothetical protein BKA82DRAFT_25803 [Pisolithus tinctorius]KIO05195.1 hypothetical protein M404DRAFT_25803 [Pisolithus tinctorius Marx 270]